jgi:hypothetical protein
MAFFPGGITQPLDSLYSGISPGRIPGSMKMFNQATLKKTKVLFIMCRGLRFPFPLKFDTLARTEIELSLEIPARPPGPASLETLWYTFIRCRMFQSCVLNIGVSVSAYGVISVGLSKLDSSSSSMITSGTRPNCVNPTYVPS